MSEEPQFVNIAADEILGTATDLTQGQVTYVNHIRVNVAANEVILDLYFLGIDPSDINKTAASRVQRVVLPLGVAKQTGSILQKLLAQWEDVFGINLPLDPIQEE